MPYEAVVTRVAEALADRVGEPSVRTTFQAFASLDLLGNQPLDAPIGARSLTLRPEYRTADTLLARLRDTARSKLLRALDTVDEAILHEILP
jgi:hypothetical protein